ncbi:MAG: response regulator transcription factor, partial [Gammaproteobacteria bacterium]|nr:response regulator transcription factor [Gammaproteobacteria bacterium]
MAKVLIADDHAMVRAGLRRWLEPDRAIETIGEAATGNETLQQLREGSWDLVVLDINMPDRSGIDILRHIRAGYPDTRVLVISAFSEKQYAIYALRAGATGYLAKDQAPQDFIRAVHTVLAGRRFVSPALAEMLVEALDQPADRPLHAALSQREFQILCKLAVGRTVSEIAHELSISVKTVSTYRARVLEKMKFTTNADITAYALK